MELIQLIEREMKARKARMESEGAQAQLAADGKAAAERLAAMTIIEHLPERITLSIQAGKDLEIMIMDYGHDLDSLTGVGKIVYDHLVAKGLKDKCFFDLDISGNFVTKNRLILRLFPKAY